MFVRLLILAFFSFFILQVPKKFLKLDYFNLNKINITGNSKILDTELTSLSNNLYNRNNFDIDYNSLEEILKKDIRIKNVDIEEVGLGEININIEETQLLYYALLKKEIYMVDKEGNIFAYINEKKRESAPLIVANSQEEVKEITELLNKILDRPLYIYISQAYKKSAEDYRIVLRDGVEIKTNFEVDEEHYKIFEIIYSEMKKSKKIEYIDLRFDDYIIKYMGDE